LESDLQPVVRVNIGYHAFGCTLLGTREREQDVMEPVPSKMGPKTAKYILKPDSFKMLLLAARLHTSNSRYSFAY
jgi:hypothetical protein